MRMAMLLNVLDVTPDTFVRQRVGHSHCVRMAHIPCQIGRIALCVPQAIVVSMWPLLQQSVVSVRILLEGSHSVRVVRWVDMPLHLVLCHVKYVLQGILVLMQRQTRSLVIMERSPHMAMVSAVLVLLGSTAAWPRWSVCSVLLVTVARLQDSNPCFAEKVFIRILVMARAMLVMWVHTARSIEHAVCRVMPDTNVATLHKDRCYVILVTTH